MSENVNEEAEVKKQEETAQPVQEEQPKDSTVTSITVTSKEVEEKNLPKPANSDEMVKSAIYDAARSQNNVKAVIDLAATGKALENASTVEKLVKEKTAELTTDAEARRIASETEKIRQEVEKVKQEAEKELAELRKQRDALEAECEKLKKLNDKAAEFFNANKSILRCIGVREKHSLGVMQFLMVPATFVFILFQFLLLPLTLTGFIIEQVTAIVGSVCGSISKNGVKIITAVICVALLAALVFGVYWIVINVIPKL